MNNYLPSKQFREEYGLPKSTLYDRVKAGKVLRKKVDGKFLYSMQNGPNFVEYSGPRSSVVDEVNARIDANRQVTDVDWTINTGRQNSTSGDGCPYSPIPYPTVELPVIRYTEEHLTPQYMGSGVPYTCFVVDSEGNQIGLASVTFAPGKECPIGTVLSIASPKTGAGQEVAEQGDILSELKRTNEFLNDIWEALV